MRVLVCGGRDFMDNAMAYKALDILHSNYGFDVVIEGDARGADRIAGYWARKNKLDNVKFPAKWTQYGKRAGPIRNQAMLDEGRPDLVVAFPGGKGTADMIARAERRDIQVVKVIDAGDVVKVARD